MNTRHHLSWLRAAAVGCIALIALVLASCTISTITITAPSSTTTPGSDSMTPGATPDGSPTATTGAGTTPTATTGGNTPTGVFRVTATASNSVSDFTVIDNPLTNGSSGLVLYVTANYQPNSIYDNHPLGVFYIASQGKWAIFHEDLANYTPNASYNVYVQSVVASTTITTFIVKAPSATSSYDFFEINNTATDGKPNALVFVTPNWNPGGSSSGVYDNHRVGMFYRSDGKWAIFHEDQQSYTPNASYNVMVLTSDNTNYFLQHACAADCSYDWIGIGSSASNSNPNAIILVTPVWNPGGNGGVYDDHNLGVYYSSNEWRIFHQDTSPYVANAAYNVLILHS